MKKVGLRKRPRNKRTWTKGIAQDYDKVAYRYTKAAEQGDAGAQSELANCYKNGIGMTKSRKLAAYWEAKSKGKE